MEDRPNFKSLTEINSKSDDVEGIHKNIVTTTGATSAMASYSKNTNQQPVNKYYNNKLTIPNHMPNNIFR